MSKHQEIITAFNQISLESDALTYEYVMKKIMKKLKVTYKDIREAFIALLEIDFGPKHRAFAKLLSAQQGRNDYENGTDSIRRLAKPGGIEKITE